MVRRRILVRDIAEILEHWQAGRSICAISRSLGVCRVTIRKYVYAVEARGYHQGDPTPPQGWKAFIAEVIPKPPDPSTRSEVFARLLPFQDEIRIHQRMIFRIKYIAAYQVAPVSAVTHWASVKNILPWENTGKFVVNFTEPAKEIEHINLVPKSMVKAPQAPRYTSFSKLQQARSLDELF